MQTYLHRLSPTLACLVVAGASATVRPAAAQSPTAPKTSCDAIPAFDTGVTPLREMHVAPPPAGNDQSGDGSPDRPYATIAFAASRATPGTAVRLRPAIYPGGTFITNLHGTPDAPIWIGGTFPPSPAGGPLTHPVLQGATEGLHLARCSYVVIENLEVHGASGNGINSDDAGKYSSPAAAHHQVFRSLLIHDIGAAGNQDGLKLSGVRDFAVLDCDISRCGGNASGSGIDLVGCHNGVIARSRLHDLSANAVQAKGGSTNILITRCRMEHAGERALNIGGSTGVQFFRPPLSQTLPNAEARHIRAVANVIVGSRAAVAFVGATDCLVAHNTIIEPTRWILRILQETVSSPPYTFDACANNTFASNLVYFRHSGLSTYVNIGPNTAPTTFTFRRNLWFAHDRPIVSKPTLPAAETDGLAGSNPLLLNPAEGDFTICVHSPAAGRGDTPPLITADFDGACYRALPAIGAFEVSTLRPCSCPPPSRLP